ncbi:MAG: HTH domain-containing protein [Chitinophagales bacterium]|nr:HTH domain-containing protein [Chitinophagales bacterium]MDW8392685.1 HTH domain-containing protein [Chitinophagales bacterium]
MTFLDLASRVLDEAKRPLTAREIWFLAAQKGYDLQLRSAGKTPWNTLAAQLYVDVRDNPESPFTTTGSRPKRFYLRAQAHVLPEVEDAPEDKADTPEIQKKFHLLEKDLHPFLTAYAFYHLNCYTKSIQHTQSTKKEFGEWVHPDMVGCVFLFEDWRQEVHELSAAVGNTSVRLLSFEIKRELSFANLRESFFQTVSNSSWANESYLVAATISEESDFLDELSRLSAAFGIGVIHLNIQNVHDSQIVFPSRHRETLDWETINKLTQMNNDFREFISTVKIDLSSRKIHKKEYNPVLESDRLHLLLKKD